MFRGEYMSQFARLFGLRVVLVLIVFVAVSSMAARPWPGESVRTELAQLQEKTGLSLVWVAGGAVQVVLFSHHSMVEANRVPVKAKWLPDGAGPGAMSPDGTEVAFTVRREQPGPAHLGISRTDGTDFREYPNLQYQNRWDNVCWSYDKSMLAMTVRNMESVLNRDPGLQIVNVSSGDTQEMVSQGSVTPQFWLVVVTRLPLRAKPPAAAVNANRKTTDFFSMWYSVTSVPEWRNWQTRRTQNPVAARP
jgi:hypothetical protein